jgi:hypothetical protein
LTSLIENFNASNFNDLGLTVSNLSLNGESSITIVSDLPGISKATRYYRTFVEKAVNWSELKNHKFNTFVITKDNFDIFYRTKGLNEYLEFFKKYYHPENP